MKGVCFCCPDCETQVKIFALVLIDSDVYLMGQCEVCKVQLRFLLSTALLQMVSEQVEVNRSVN